MFLNALRWLRPPSPFDPHLLPVGETFFLPTGVALDTLRLSTPQAEARPLETDTLLLDYAGAYRVTGDAYQTVLYANLFDEAESNIGRQATEADLEQSPTPLQTEQIIPEEIQRETPVEFGQSLYWLAAILLLGEWLYALRRSRMGRVA